MARFALNDYSRYSSVSSMLHHLQWPTLENRRTYLKLLLFYKIEKSLVDININLQPIDSVTRGHSCHYTIPLIRTETFVNSFLPSATKMWNNLPESLVMIDSFNELKDRLAHYISVLFTLYRGLHSNNNNNSLGTSNYLNRSL